MSTYLGIPTARRDVGELGGGPLLSGRGPRRAGRRAAAANLGPGHRHDHRRSAARWSSELPDWEELRAAGSAIKADTMARLPELLEQLESSEVDARGGHGALGPGRRRGQRASSPTWCARPGPTRWSRSSRWPPRRSGSTRPWPPPASRPRDRPGRAHRAARPRPAQPHPGAGDPQEPQRDPRHLPARDARRGPAARRRTRRPWPRPPGPTCAGRSCARGSPCPAPTSPSPRPARSSSWSPRATAGCA